MGNIKKGIHFLIFVTIVSAICHYLYSWIGFNPTDEGFVLAGARRILDGQFPHADFLSLRPMGSSYFHILDIKYGGDHVFYFSRLMFWIQSAIIAWFWVAIANKLIKLEIILPYKYLLAAIVFIFNVHNFPPMAWTTVDGLFFATLGIFFITHFSKNANQFGYLLLGCAALCKQNFLILIPGVFVIMGHFKRPYYIIDGITPILVYFFFIWKFEALPEAIDQLFARKELLETGVMAFIKTPGLYVGLVIPLAINLFRSRFKNFLQNIDFILVFSLLILGGSALFLNAFVGDFSFGLFGFLLGYTIVHIKRKGVIMYNALTLLLAWTVSISLGYNTPAMASGLILCALLTINYDRSNFGIKKPIKFAFAGCVFCFLLFSFDKARNTYVYKDNKAELLTADLGSSLKGGANIKTNDLTVEAFAELDSLRKKYQDSLIIAPDYSAFWVTSTYQNPLNLDWPNRGEMESEYFQIAVKEHLLSLQDSIIIALQKYRASELYLGLNPLEDEEIQFPIVDIVEENFIRVGETKFFLLYR